MEFDRAVEICKEFAPNGDLQDGMERMTIIIDEMGYGVRGGVILTNDEIEAYMIVLEKMRALF